MAEDAPRGRLVLEVRRAETYELEDAIGAGFAPHADADVRQRAGVVDADAFERVLRAVLDVGAEVDEDGRAVEGPELEVVVVARGAEAVVPLEHAGEVDARGDVHAVEQVPGREGVVRAVGRGR